MLITFSCSLNNTLELELCIKTARSETRRSLFSFCLRFTVLIVNIRYKTEAQRLVIYVHYNKTSSVEGILQFTNWVPCLSFSRYSLKGLYCFTTLIEETRLTFLNQVGHLWKFQNFPKFQKPGIPMVCLYTFPLKRIKQLSTM